MSRVIKHICNFRLCMVNYIILYKKFVEHHVIKLILLKISHKTLILTCVMCKCASKSTLMTISYVYTKYRVYQKKGNRTLTCYKAFNI